MNTQDLQAGKLERTPKAWILWPHTRARDPNHDLERAVASPCGSRTPCSGGPGVAGLRSLAIVLAQLAVALPCLRLPVGGMTVFHSPSGTHENHSENHTEENAFLKQV